MTDIMIVRSRHRIEVIKHKLTGSVTTLARRAPACVCNISHWHLYLKCLCCIGSTHARTYLTVSPIDLCNNISPPYIGPIVSATGPTAADGRINDGIDLLPPARLKVQIAFLLLSPPSHRLSEKWPAALIDWSNWLVKIFKYSPCDMK